MSGVEDGTKSDNSCNALPTPSVLSWLTAEIALIRSALAINRVFSKRMLKNILYFDFDQQELKPNRMAFSIQSSVTFLSSFPYEILRRVDFNFF